MNLPSSQQSDKETTVHLLKKQRDIEWTKRVMNYFCISFVSEDGEGNDFKFSIEEDCDDIFIESMF